jgi:hypothetical protein
MKKIYIFILALYAFFDANAQKDTLLFEGFSGDVLAQAIKVPTGKDLVWINWDKDAIAPGEGTSGNWYQAPEVYEKQVTKPKVFNQTAHSLSWLKGDVPGNKNILISPPISITDDKAVLSWRSCPLQGPGFMDGYKVLITTTSNDVAKAKPDTVFIAAEVTTYKDPNTLNLADYKFSKGYIHAGEYKLKQYWDTTGLTTIHRGRLEPHSVSLAKYAGKKIYVHFYHDSNDDYIFELDDILVKGSKAVNTKDVNAENIRLVTYPNPTVNFLNVLYRSEKTENTTVKVTDILGKTVLVLFSGQTNGEMNQNFDVSSLSAGSYFLQVTTGEKTASEKFIKE